MLGRSNGEPDVCDHAGAGKIRNGALFARLDWILPVPIIISSGRVRRGNAFLSVLLLNWQC